MERVREILRVETPKQVPDVPEYVLGVLTVRGQILPIIDLRRLLQQRSLADEFASACQEVREDYERWLEQWKVSMASNDHARADLAAAERLRAWLSNANSSSQVHMEALSKIRGLNEKAVKQLQNRVPAAEVAVTTSLVVVALHHFE
jgi:hypothetical protein